MKLYRLDIAPEEHQPEGEDFGEWFSSLAETKHRRTELIRQDPELTDHRYGADFEIRRYTLPELPTRALMLHLLNRGWWRDPSEVVVSEYIPPRRRGHERAI